MIPRRCCLLPWWGRRFPNTCAASCERLRVVEEVPLLECGEATALSLLNPHATGFFESFRSRLEAVNSFENKLSLLDRLTGEGRGSGSEFCTPGKGNLGTDISMTCEGRGVNELLWLLV